MTHPLPDDSPSMWPALEHAGRTYPTDPPDPADYLGLVDMPPMPGCDNCDSPWQPPLCRCDVFCNRCGRNELRRNETICRECADDILAEEAHDRGRPGEWS